MYSDAIDYLNRFLTHFNDDYIAHYLIGELYYLNSNFEQAKEHFKSALSINPNDHLSLYHLGMCNFQIEDFINAAKYFKKSIFFNLTV